LVGFYRAFSARLLGEVRRARVLDELGPKPLVKEHDLRDRERARIREPGVVSRALQQHFAVGRLRAREPRVGAVAHDSVDYWSAKKKKLARASSRPWKSRAGMRFEKSPLFVPVMSAIAATVFETSLPFPYVSSHEGARVARLNVSALPSSVVDGPALGVDHELPRQMSRSIDRAHHAISLSSSLSSALESSSMRFAAHMRENSCAATSLATFNWAMHAFDSSSIGAERARALARLAPAVVVAVRFERARARRP
jgi:hypothetical protein